MFRDVIALNGLTVDDWKFFFDCMHELMLAFEFERAKRSLEIWGMEYDVLDCRQKEALINVVDYKVIIDFFNTIFDNCNYNLPPPKR